jgi:hypothetical protein
MRIYPGTREKTGEFGPDERGAEYRPRALVVASKTPERAEMID